MKDFLEQLKTKLELSASGISEDELRQEIIDVLQQTGFEELVEKYDIENVPIEIGNCPDVIAFVRWVSADVTQVRNTRTGDTLTRKYDIEKLCFDPDSVASDKNLKETVVHEATHITFEHRLGSGKNAHQKKFYRRMIDMLDQFYGIDDELQKIVEMDMSINGRADIDASRFFSEPVFEPVAVFRDRMEDVIDNFSKMAFIISQMKRFLNGDISTSFSMLDSFEGKWVRNNTRSYERLEWTTMIELKLEGRDDFSLFKIDREDRSWESFASILWQKPTSIKLEDIDFQSGEASVQSVDFESIDQREGGDYTDLISITEELVEAYEDIKEEAKQQIEDAQSDARVVDVETYNTLSELVFNGIQNVVESQEDIEIDNEDIMSGLLDGVDNTFDINFPISVPLVIRGEDYFVTLRANEFKEQGELFMRKPFEGELQSEKIDVSRPAGLSEKISNMILDVAF